MNNIEVEMSILSLSDKQNNETFKHNSVAVFKKQTIHIFEIKCDRAELGDEEFQLNFTHSGISKFRIGPFKAGIPKSSKDVSLFGETVYDSKSLLDSFPSKEVESSKKRTASESFTVERNPTKKQIRQEFSKQQSSSNEYQSSLPILAISNRSDNNPSSSSSRESVIRHPINDATIESYIANCFNISTKKLENLYWNLLTRATTMEILLSLLDAKNCDYERYSASSYILWLSQDSIVGKFIIDVLISNNQPTCTSKIWNDVATYFPLDAINWIDHYSKTTNNLQETLKKFVKDKTENIVQKLFKEHRYDEVKQCCDLLKKTTFT